MSPNPDTNLAVLDQHELAVVHLDGETHELEVLARDGGETSLLKHSQVRVRVHPNPNPTLTLTLTLTLTCSWCSCFCIATFSRAARSSLMMFCSGPSTW